ncbi:DNA recombination protein RmuC [Prevotella sp. MGM1]|uniref:DNA recombination protein RmuC n=1 Tax=Prevotella sp. MGM1 TaxID=2033405 RepID=UPI000D0C36F1|nr:DNA recombination protein RmuC [Prevotella sp. MGM1]GAY28373.1 DNA recombination protein RmuC [Prevotella sp. MGM1]
MAILIAIISAVTGICVTYALMRRGMSEKDKVITARSIEMERTATELGIRNEQLARLAERATALEAENKTLGARSQSQAREIELLRKHADEEARVRREQFAEQLRTAKEQIANMATRIMEQNADKLKERNTENIGHITQPLKDAISEMRKAITDNIKDSAEHSASFREQICRMIESNREIGEKAESLANVLRRDNKAAGNMGEIILGDLLASQGLTEGIHYEVQARLRDETGRALKNDETDREMQPDVILHYPQGQDAIIDSKVSLVAYQRYVNAETAEERDRHLQDHIKSVRRHVGELARKDYSKYIRAPREAVDFVIMFVPFESSLQLALANDPTLWREAFERKVFITGEQNLLGILHMIHIAWVQNQQAENQEKVFGTAEQLIDRLGDFIKRYNDLGDALEKSRKAYDFANNKLVTGAQSVVKKGRELVDLGAKENPNRRIPKPDDVPGIE